MNNFTQKIFTPALVIGTVAFGMVFAGTAAAATLSYNAGVVAPTGETDPTQPVYFGTGNPNGAFTIDTENGIELGLRADLRFAGPVTPVVGTDGTQDTYVVPAGTDPNHMTGACSTGCAYWNFVYSIDLQPSVGTSSGLSFSDVTTSLTLKDTSGTLGSTNPITTFVDNAEVGPSGTTSGASGPQAGAWAAQNSENLKFLGIPFNSADNYELDLVVKNTAGAILASDTIFIDAVATPEPSTLGLFGGALLGLFFLARRRTA